MLSIGPPPSLPDGEPAWGAPSVTGLGRPTGRSAPAQARLSGAIRSRSFLRPTEVKITTASASSPDPEVSTTRPSPH